MSRSFIIVLSISALFGCKESKLREEVEPNLREASQWYHLDPEKQGVAGISLDKAYDELLAGREGNDVIVAIIDTQVSLYHEDLEQQIFINEGEIPHNEIDDDKNGFIDDVNGWNFLGYGKYMYEKNASYSYIRVINALKHKFEGKDSTDIGEKNLKEFKRYKEALEKQAKKSEDIDFMRIARKARELFNNFKIVFSDRIPGHADYTKEQLDSLEIRNEEEKELVDTMKRYISYGYDFEYAYRDEEMILLEVHTLNNPNYNERSNIGDDPFDYETTGYGNGNTDALHHVWHGTQVSGILAATRNNGIGIRGVSNNIKIMPLVVSPEKGTHNDKDIAFAIRYAVDNGAKVINMSGGKEYTENEELLFSALKYAEAKGVLFITSAGNSAQNIDNPETPMYLRDTFGAKDSVSNLIRLGSSTKNLDSTLVSKNSNYGKNNVDLFAPGFEMRTTDTRNDRYASNSGTSLSAALTSGVAALIISYYPELSYKQVKQILLDSGTPYEFNVVDKNGDKVPFGSLSKSGKVLNAYNALKMAEEISSKKN